MAPNGHGASRRSDTHQSQATQHQNLLDQFGHSEYQIWRNGNPTKHLSYDDWKISQHVDGLSLYYAALKIFEETDSSSEETELIEVKPRACGVRGPSAHEPKKKKMMNGTHLSRAAGSAKSSAPANSEDQNASAKRKRKSRKKYLSKEIVASDGDSELEEAGKSTFSADPETLIEPLITTSGRQRKSHVRKPRKMPLSEETISPEDELDDPMMMDEVVTSVVASPLPVRTAPKTLTTARNSESPKKTFLKLSTRKAPRKPFLSEETVIDDDIDDAQTPTLATEPDVNAATDLDVSPLQNENVDAYDNGGAGPLSTNGRTLLNIGKESDASKRRGLRARRPAQQPSYYHDVQLFDDVEPNADQLGDYSNDDFDAGSRRVSVASLTKGVDEGIFEDLHEDNTAILQVDPDLESFERRPKHFKGKGRAWRKEESDEDEEFTLAKKKAAKAAKAKPKPKPKAEVAVKKRGRPRKSVLSEDIIRDESDSDAAVKAEDTSGIISPATPKPQAGLRKAKIRLKKKSALSEEIVRDDSDSATTEKANAEETAHDSEQKVATPSSQKRARLQILDQSMKSKDANESNLEEEVLPNQSYTIQDTSKSSSPKGTPVQIIPFTTEAHEAETERDGSTGKTEEAGSQGHAQANTPPEKQSVGVEDEEKIVAESMDDSVLQTPLPQAS